MSQDFILEFVKTMSEFHNLNEIIVENLKQYVKNVEQKITTPAGKRELEMELESKRCDPKMSRRFRLKRRRTKSIVDMVNNFLDLLLLTYEPFVVFLNPS